MLVYNRAFFNLLPIFNLMKLSIAENFYILIHHPDKPRIVVTETARNAGMIGAILLDLSIGENIILENGLLKVKSARTTLPSCHKMILDKLSDAPKLRKPKNWISRMVQAPSKPKRALWENLEKKGILELVPRRFLFIPYTQTWLIKRELRDKLIRDLRSIVFDKKEVDPGYASLLGLIQATKMYKLIAHTAVERKQARTRIKSIIESDVIMEGVGKVIQEMQAAMMAAIVASTAATSAAAASS